MNVSGVIAVVGVIIAFIDFFDVARRVDAAIRKLIGLLPHFASAAWREGEGFEGLKNIAGVVSVIAALVFMSRPYGKSVISWINSWISWVFDSPWRYVPFLLLLSPILMFVAAGAMWVLWTVLRLLAWPRRGIVATVGLVAAVIGLLFELAH
jgi:hypothetical protein